MKYLVWSILLVAGSATAYVLLSSPGDRPEKPLSSSPTAEIAAENPSENERESPPPSTLSGGPTEMILPLDAGSKKPKMDKLIEENDGPEIANRHDENADNDNHDERDLILGDLPRNEPLTFRKLRPKNTDTASAPPSPAVSSTAAVPSAPSSSAPSPSTPSSSSGKSSPSLGGSFPALPASAGSSSSTSASSAPTPSTPTPSTAVVPRSQIIAPPVNAEKKTASLPIVSAPKAPGGTDEIIKPLGITIPVPPPETQTTDGNQENAWIEAMKIPTGFAGLSLSPATVAAVSPNQPLSAVPETQPAVLGATWKSSFEATDKPTLQILKECPADPAAGECDPHPPGGPMPADYFYLGDRHQEDLKPESKTTFEIGTTVINTVKDANGKEVPQSEAAFHLAPGSVPGKYQVILFTENTKLIGSFEVVAPAAAAQALTESATSRTNAAPQSSLPLAKPPVLK